MRTGLMNSLSSYLYALNCNSAHTCWSALAQKGQEAASARFLTSCVCPVMRTANRGAQRGTESQRMRDTRGCVCALVQRCYAHHRRQVAVTAAPTSPGLPRAPPGVHGTVRSGTRPASTPKQRGRSERCAGCLCLLHTRATHLRLRVRLLVELAAGDVQVVADGLQVVLHFLLVEQESPSSRDSTKVVRALPAHTAVATQQGCPEAYLDTQVAGAEHVLNLARHQQCLELWRQVRFAKRYVKVAYCENQHS